MVLCFNPCLPRYDTKRQRVCWWEQFGDYTPYKRLCSASFPSHTPLGWTWLKVSFSRSVQLTNVQSGRLCPGSPPTGVEWGLGVGLPMGPRIDMNYGHSLTMRLLPLFKIPGKCTLHNLIS